VTPADTHPVEALASWDRPVSSVRFVDDTRAEAFDRLGVRTVGDLVHHYPFRYLDLTHTPDLRDVRAGEEATVVGRVHAVKVKRPRPRLTIVEVALVDGTGIVLGVWFNQPYMAQRFVEGERVAFAGRVEMEYGFKQIKQPFVEKLGADDDPADVGRIVPAHHATEGLTKNWIRRLVTTAIEDAGRVPDFLPVRIRIQRELISLGAALRAIHFPRTLEERDAARKRLAYDELFVLQLGMAVRRHRAVMERPGIAHTVDGPSLQALRETVPYQLTPDQDVAVREILSDMARPAPMNRMLLGDVGTGKTVVAAHALCAASDTGSQAAMMAPTEVLAIQYADKVGPLLDAASVTWALLTGSVTAAARRDILAGLANGELSVVFGTHALLETAVEFKRLSLAIVDEQHRFGVEQRLGLRSKGASADMLVMTATPIPRSLALTLYGDLAVSYLRERPAAVAGSRTTRVADRRHRGQAYEKVRAEAREGRQAYVVCPLVKESEAAQARAAVDEAERLATEVFPDLRVGLLTGRMKPAEKADVMKRFRSGELDVLVTTTVVEVGVDVPNATVMIVEDAERFGLAQLHQLRGRVGRGEHPAEVVLFADPKTEEGRARMNAILATDDGFELAEYDMRLRGEGQLLGEKQHGLPELRLASLAEDGALLEAAREDARALVLDDPHLRRAENALLARELERRFASAWAWVSSG